MRSSTIRAACILLLGATCAPAAPVPAGADLAGPLRLEALLPRAVRQSPAVRASDARWRAASRKRPQVVALPDPQLEAMPFLVTMTDEDEEWGVGFSQMIPHPKRRAAAGRIADKEARAAYLRYQLAARDAIWETKEAFFELWYIDRARRVTHEVSRLYDRFAALAAGGVEPGGPRLPETFRAEAQRAQVSYDLVLLQQMRLAEEQRLRSAIGMMGSDRLGATEDVAEPPESIPRIEDLEALARERSQELALAGVEVERAADQVALARLSRTPDFALGLQYMKTGGAGLPEGDPTRDPLRVTFGVTLPVWGTKNRAIIDEARATQVATIEDRAARELTVRSDLARAYFGLSNSARLVRLYRDNLIPQSRQALRSAEALHRTGAASMLAVIETTATFQNFELARLRATADFYQNIARIERIIGTALVIRPQWPPGTKEDRRP